MSRARHVYSVLLLVALMFLIALAVTSKAGEARVPKRIQEPAGPKPQVLKTPADFDRFGDWLHRTQARQEVALARYRFVFRSYLRWRKFQQARDPEVVFLPSRPRGRCKALNIITPRNWCWYATAASWTARELAETRARIQDRRRLPATRDWQTAVRITQRVYPGTESWLLSCSAAEGGHGNWVWYGGRTWQGRHVGNDFLGMDTVGGWMQFRWSTFKPYWYGYRGAHGARRDVLSRGFKIPDLGEGYGPWLSPLGQALTAGYMRAVLRNTSLHWSASVGNGC